MLIAEPSGLLALDGCLLSASSNKPRSRDGKSPPITYAPAYGNRTRRTHYLALKSKSEVCWRNIEYHANKNVTFQNAKSVITLLQFAWSIFEAYYLSWNKRPPPLRNDIDKDDIFSCRWPSLSKESRLHKIDSCSKLNRTGWLNQARIKLITPPLWSLTLSWLDAGPRVGLTFHRQKRDRSADYLRVGRSIIYHVQVGRNSNYWLV